MGFKTSQLEKVPRKGIQTFKGRIYTISPGIESKPASQGV